jgi:hypothetical protein
MTTRTVPKATAAKARTTIMAMMEAWSLFASSAAGQLSNLVFSNPIERKNGFRVKA